MKYWVEEGAAGYLEYPKKQRSRYEYRPNIELPKLKAKTPRVRRPSGHEGPIELNSQLVEDYQIALENLQRLGAEIEKAVEKGLNALYREEEEY